VAAVIAGLRGKLSADGVDVMKTLVWRRLDEPGMEVAHVRSFSSASGVQIGRSYEVRWSLEDDSLELELNADRQASFGLEGADFFDVFASPFFNSLPVMRDGLLDAGPAREYVMRFVDVPDLTASNSNQRYEPVGQQVVRYSSGSFHAEIEFDKEGLVERYEGFLERVSETDDER
jgi:hypothetical protein